MLRWCRRGGSCGAAYITRPAGGWVAWRTGVSAFAPCVSGVSRCDSRAFFDMTRAARGHKFDTSPRSLAVLAAVRSGPGPNQSSLSRLHLALITTSVTSSTLLSNLSALNLFSTSIRSSSSTSTTDPSLFTIAQSTNKNASSQSMENNHIIKNGGLNVRLRPNVQPVVCVVIFQALGTLYLRGLGYREECTDS